MDVHGVAASPRGDATGDRLGYLDALRAIAALLVVYFHYLYEYLLIHGSHTLSVLDHWMVMLTIEVVDIGKVGVVIFFAISGFIISRSLLNGGQHQLRTFFISRFFRLYPIYWISVFAAVAVIWSGRTVDLKTILMNLTMMPQYLGSGTLQAMYWSLSIELTFYVLCAAAWRVGLLNNLIHTQRIAFLLLAVALVSSGFRYVLEVRVPVVVPLSLSIMFWARLWQQWVIEKDAVARKLSDEFLVVFVLAMPVIGVLAYNQDYGLNEVWYRHTLSYLLGLFVFMQMTTRYRIEYPLLIKLGAASYSMYLFHVIIVRLLNQALADTPFTAMPAQLQIAAGMVVACLCSIALFNHVEKPFVRMGRALNQNWTRLFPAPVRASAGLLEQR